MIRSSVQKECSQEERGFALLISVIFMSVMLTFGLALGSLAYKQQALSSSAVGSQYAFYAADAALECLLYADQQLNFFAFPTTDPASMNSYALSCGGSSGTVTSKTWTAATRWIVTERLSLDGGKSCADVTIYKPASTASPTYLFSQGYNVACTTLGTSARFTSRGIKASY